MAWMKGMDGDYGFRLAPEWRLGVGMTVEGFGMAAVFVSEREASDDILGYLDEDGVEDCAASSPAQRTRNAKTPL